MQTDTLIDADCCSKGSTRFSLAEHISGVSQVIFFNILFRFRQGFKEKCHSVKSVDNIAVSVLVVILVDFDKYRDEEACLEKHANK